MVSRKRKTIPTPNAGWAVYLRTSSDETQKPELSRARQRDAIQRRVLDHTDMPVYDEYIDVLTGSSPQREAYQRLLEDARDGKFSHVIVERADRFGRNDTEALRAIDELHEFGVAVRFANQDGLDPMDPDDRVFVAMSFSMARRETALLSIRVKGGVKAKRDEGGYHGKAPDGYRNASGQLKGQAKKLNGRYAHWIEPDPERAPVIRLLFDLLLTDRYTLEDICEEMHKRGHRYGSGKPFIEIRKDGKRKANYSTLSYIYHNWTYAGWVISEKHNIPPKTIRGKWEPIVSTEEFERGLKILEKRTKHRTRKTKRDYLLRGLTFYRNPKTGSLQRLSGSTPNAGRKGGGNSYYCVGSSNINFSCDDIEAKVADELKRIQVDPKLIPVIRSVYTQDVAEKLGHSRPDERTQLESALKAIDDEESKAARLYVSGQISDHVWSGLWSEWQDKRNRIHNALDLLKHKNTKHIDNLDSALQITTYVGLVYNDLSREDQRELLRQMVERVIVDSDGSVKLELRTPFSYIHDISDQVCRYSEGCGSPPETKTADQKVSCSDQVLFCWETWTRTRNGGTRIRSFAN